jgi:hypothetical protein
MAPVSPSHPSSEASPCWATPPLVPARAPHGIARPRGKTTPAPALQRIDRGQKYSAEYLTYALYNKYNKFLSPLTLQQESAASGAPGTTSDGRERAAELALVLGEGAQLEPGLVRRGLELRLE